MGLALILLTPITGIASIVLIYEIHDSIGDRESIPTNLAYIVLMILMWLAVIWGWSDLSKYRPIEDMEKYTEVVELVDMATGKTYQLVETGYADGK